MTIRVDFGRIFPGIVLIVVGAALFCLWLILVFVSFFAYFAGLGWIFQVALDFLAASLVLMGVGGLVLLAGVSGWWTQGSVTWGRHHEVVNRDVITPGQRSGEVFGVVISFFILLFFIDNQVRGTGFFTARFGPLEEALFYGTWLAGALVSLARAAVGRRNAVRPFDVLYGGLLLVTALTLLKVFPFDFAHIPDLLPAAVRPAFFWLTNPVGRILLVLVAIGGLATMVYNAVVFAIRVSSETA